MVSITFEDADAPRPPLLPFEAPKTRHDATRRRGQGRGAEIYKRGTTILRLRKLEAERAAEVAAINEEIETHYKPEDEAAIGCGYTRRLPIAEN